MWQDLRLALRALRKNPEFTTPALLALALGIGANATIFTLVDAMVLRPLPVADSERIVHVYQMRRGREAQTFPLSFPDYLAYRDAVDGFEMLAAHYPTSPMHVVVNDEPAGVNGAVVTASYFDVLQLTPAAGRFFGAEEDRIRGQHPVAVIGHGSWQRWFGGKAEAIGSTIRVNGTAFTVVGVAPRGFRGVQPRGPQTEIWIPSAMFGVGYRYCDAFERDCPIVAMLGKLRREVSIERAQRELDVVAARLEAAHPATNTGRGIRIEPARGLGRGPQADERRQISLYLAAVSVVLLIACANVAGLLLARGASRRQEIAVRLALGATRWRIVRYLLTESVAMAALGGGFGLLLAAWGGVLLEQVFQVDGAGRPLDFQLAMRSPVFAATAVVSLLSALVFGLAPSLQASGGDTAHALKPGNGRVAGRGGWRVLVAAQVASSVMLLIGALLLIQSARQLHRGSNFDPEGVMMLRLRPSLVDYPRDRAFAYHREIVRALESTPGVASASPSVFLSVIGAGLRVAVSPDRTAEPFEAVQGHGGARYFETLHIPVLDGRDFGEQDDERGVRVAIVNDVLARRIWPATRAVGNVLNVDGVPHTVVGVVADAQYYGAGEHERPQVFVSYWQTPAGDPFLNDARMMIRVNGAPEALLPLARRVAARVDRDVPINEDGTLLDRVRYAYQPLRLARGLVSSFATIALVLTGVGIYGVLAFSVGQRTREIAIRLAIGARRTDILRLMLKEGVGVTLAGCALGLGGGWLASRLLRTLLYGIDARDLISFASAPLVVLAVAICAAVVPARRATSVLPAVTLRGE